MQSECKQQLKSIPKEFRRHDTSQHGDRSNFRNVTLDKKPFRIAKGATPVSLMRLGTLLEFDFVSTIRPARDSKVFTSCQLCEVLEGLDMLLACKESNKEASAARHSASSYISSEAPAGASSRLHEDPVSIDRDDLEQSFPHPELLSASFTLHLRKW